MSASEPLEGNRLLKVIDKKEYETYQQESADDCSLFKVSKPDYKSGNYQKTRKKTIATSILYCEIRATA